MSKSTTAKSEPAGVYAKPEAFEPKASDINIEMGFHTFKMVSLKVPESFDMQSLNDNPRQWHRVQADRSGKALAKYDRIEMRGKDFIVTAIVSHADGEQVILSSIKR